MDISSTRPYTHDGALALTTPVSATAATGLDLSRLLPQQGATAVGRREVVPDRELQEFLNSVQRLGSELAQSNGSPSLEALYMRVCEAELEGQDRSIQMRGSLLDRTQSERRELNKQALEKMEQWHQSQKTTKWWTIFSKLAMSFQVITAGTATLISGGSALPIIALVLTIGATADELMDHAAKRKLAGVLSQGDKASKDKWQSRLQLGATILGFVASAGLASGPAAAAANNLMANVHKYVQYGVTCSENAGFLGRAWRQVQTDRHEADYLQLDAQGDKASANLKRQLTNVKQCSEAVNETFAGMAKSQQAQHRSVLQAIQMS